MAHSAVMPPAVSSTRERLSRLRSQLGIPVALGQHSPRLRASDASARGPVKCSHYGIQKQQSVSGSLPRERLGSGPFASVEAMNQI